MMKTKATKPDLRCLPSKVYGIDFSGAKNAGSKVWIASAVIVGSALQIEDCYQAKDLPDSDAERDRCLGALRGFISRQKACAFGLDFPFSLPMRLIKANNWEEFVLSFGSRYSDPEQFRKDCRRAAGGPESKSKRETDKEAKTPWCVYNLRIYKQTYYGIRDLLAPLVRDRLAYIIPMQRKLPGKPWLFEVCPASTLKNINLYLSPYKKRDMESRVHRERIIKGLEETGTVRIKSSELHLKILGDWHGDALDSVIAAFATFRALGNTACSSVPGTSAYELEGYVFV